MDCWVGRGTVVEITADKGSKQELKVLIDNKDEKAVNFPH